MSGEQWQLNNWKKYLQEKIIIIKALIIELWRGTLSLKYI